jgi:uncharacterized protein YbgA (DUF1722 family)
MHVLTLADFPPLMAALIDDYRNGLIPRVVPMALMRHYARGFEVQYLASQVYLNPHPNELMLRNHV